MQLKHPSPEERAIGAALLETAEDIATIGWRHRLLSRIPSGQLLRYLMVGVLNTIFGYSVFALFNWMLHRRGVPASYMYAQVISNFISITVAFVGYKYFVFRSKGNFYREWLKAIAVYFSGFLPGLILLPTITKLLQYGLHISIERAPYIASAVLILYGVVYGFLGHKNVTFRQKPVPQSAQIAESHQVN